MVTDRLRRLDQVAYVRFASVYRDFKTLEELVDQAKAVLDARRFEGPSQGRLFLKDGVIRERKRPSSADKRNRADATPQARSKPRPKPEANASPASEPEPG